MLARQFFSAAGVGSAAGFVSITDAGVVSCSVPIPSRIATGCRQPEAGTAAAFAPR